MFADRSLHVKHRLNHLLTGGGAPLPPVPRPVAGAFTTRSQRSKNQQLVVTKKKQTRTSSNFLIVRAKG